MVRNWPNPIIREGTRPQAPVRSGPGHLLIACDAPGELRDLLSIGRRRFVLSVFFEMSFLKRFKKSRQPSKQPMSLGIPTQIAVGALGMNANLDRDVGSEGVFRPAKSRNRLRRSDYCTRRKQQEGL